METIKDNPPSPSMDFPDQNFRCPISTDLMKDPVTICTGVTYERKNIEKWFYLYNKNTCPATMQFIDSLEITPNHTLKRLIESWQIAKTHQTSVLMPEQIPRKHDDVGSLLKTIESTPFKVSSLKKLRSLIESRDDLKDEFKKFGGIDVIVKIIVHILVEDSDFAAFRACEEALGILHQLPLCDGTVELLVKPECIKSYALMLQRGGGEARFYAVSLFHKLAKMNHDWINHIINDEGIDFFKSLLEIVSDEIFAKSSSCALEVLIDVLESSKKSRLKAIEAGAVCTLIELLPDSNRSKCERIMHIIKLICECADGRLAFIEHGLGIAAISKKILHVSNLATKTGVKILSLIGNSHPTETVLEEMLMSGAVKKFVAILNIGGESSTKKRAIKIFKLHSKFWKRYPCFPRELCDHLGIGSKFC